MKFIHNLISGVSDTVFTTFRLPFHLSDSLPYSRSAIRQENKQKSKQTNRRPEPKLDVSENCKKMGFKKIILTICDVFGDISSKHN